MKNKNLINNAKWLLVVAFAMISAQQLWAEDATVANLTISSRPASASETLTDDQSNSWAFTASEAPHTETNMIHIGTNSRAVEYIQLVCSGLSTKSISKIQVWGAAKASTSTVIKVYIGENLLGTSEELSNTAISGGTEYSVNNSSNYSGAVKIRVERPSSATGAIYFNKAIVTYTSGTKYTVTWNDNSGQLKSESITEGSTSYSCPSPAPTTAANCGDKFMGWTTSSSYKANTPPTVLFTDDSGTKPAINADTDFYAVFADEE
ncbi:MAG: hypothetical protein IJP76_04680 [Paludibacteraceae bacterium]|nr:hypothetical protein [Paludibacteraceae bacterium]